MTNLFKIGSKIAAAVSAVALSAAFMATAIVPAIPSLAASGMIA